jgi:predicted PurR-regulated permease PerM
MPVTDGARERDRRGALHVLFDAGNVWRTSFVVLGVLAVAYVFVFILQRGAALLFVVLMAWFASLAMEPAVSRLAHRMRRPAATALVMLSVALFLLAFFALFGQLFVTQVAALVRGLPDILANVLAWVNETFDQSYRLEDLLGSVTIDPDQAAGIAAQIASRLLGIIASVAGGIASFFMFLLFTFYLSADGPRLRFWIASLFPPRMQQFTLVAWDTTAEKTGGYVGARVILASVNATASAVVFAIIGLPSWLALAIWTGLVAQFVPAIGTYIAISLPVLVGLLSDRPWTGIAALAWGIVYQQVENLTLEPRISARAVNVHPAVSFASVILGGALFGVAGALLAIPVAAMLLTLLDLYRTRYALVPELASSPEALAATPAEEADAPPSADPET